MKHESSTQRTARRDGWTSERRRDFLERLAGGSDVRRACAGIGLSRESVYRLRRREPAFARAWDEALRMARRRAEQTFLAMLPPRLLRTMSELSGECELHGGARGRLDSVSVVAGV